MCVTRLSLFSSRDVLRLCPELPSVQIVGRRFEEPLLKRKGGRENRLADVSVKTNKKICATASDAMEKAAQRRSAARHRLKRAGILSSPKRAKRWAKHFANSKEIVVIKLREKWKAAIKLQSPLIVHCRPVNVLSLTDDEADAKNRQLPWKKFSMLIWN